MRYQRRQLMEHLEPRTLLSVSLAMPGGRAAIGVTRVAVQASTTSPTSTGIGKTLNLTAGVPFTGEVAFYPSPVLDPPLTYGANIDWGDGTVTAGTLQYGAEGTVYGYKIIGTHTYATAGTFRTTTTVFTQSIGASGSPVLPPIRIVATIVGKAIVVPATGLTLYETAGQSFTADLGSFTTLAPGTGLQATISWGDGTSSVGKLQPSGVVGIDLVKFDVLGTHTYVKAGTYPIQVVVTKASLTPTSTPPQIVATLNDTAIVKASTTISLAGTITGTYLLTPVATPDIGQTFVFTGAGTAGDLGAVSAKATITLPGFIAMGHATGMLTLTNADGSVTLRLASPVQPAAAAFPHLLSYAIVSATGAYVGDTAKGTMTVTLTPAATAGGANMFTFVLS